MQDYVKPFLFFICDTPTGNAYYLDSNGNIQTAPIHNGTNLTLSLTNAPDGWLNSELGYMRNAHYFGLNRTYTIPLKMVNDAAKIVRTLYYLGLGVETPLTLVIFKYNDNPNPGDPQYKLYYKGILDLPKNLDLAGEGINVNIMEGGVIQLLKAFENATFPVPCDGSLNEHVKVYMDGLLLQDTWYEQIPQFVDPYANFCVVLPTVFIQNDGDNVGVIGGNQNLQDSANDPNFFKNSNNYSLSFSTPTTVTIQGQIVVASSDLTQFAELKVGFVTDQTLTPSSNPWKAYCIGSAAHPVFVKSKQVFTFNVTISLAANEKLFMVYNNIIPVGGPGAAHVQFFSSYFQYFFTSSYPATSVWGLIASDYWKILGQKTMAAAATTNQTFNYRFDSTFLKQKQNYVITSGDAIRASGDPNYHKFYNAAQINPNFPNLNQPFTFGPVIKQSIAEFFDSMDAIENCALSNQIVAFTVVYATSAMDLTVGTGAIYFNPGRAYPISLGMSLVWKGNTYYITSVSYDPVNGYSIFTNGTLPAATTYFAQSFSITQPADGSESLFLEKKSYVFDSTKDVFDLGEVRDLKFSLAEEYFFNRFKIGYRPQTYDQKAGKYEYNTTAEWMAPIKSLSRTIEKISSMRTDSYGIERLRSNIAKTSTTNNDSDDSVFLINVNEKQFNYDKFVASFLSTITDTTQVQNTNQRLIANMRYQGITLPNFVGSYLSYDNTACIFLFNQTLSGVTKIINVSFNGTMTGLPGDQLTINLMCNGVILNQWIFTMPGGQTFSVSGYTTSRPFNTGDSLYLTVQATPTASATIAACSLSVTTGASNDFTATSGPQAIAQGSPPALIKLPDVVNAVDSNNHPVVSFGFQYFYFNSILANNNFNCVFNIQGLMQDAGNSFRADLYLNGQLYESYTYNYSGSGQQSFTGTIAQFNRNWSLGDLVWIVVTATNNNNTYITEADLDLISTQIKAFYLKRAKYYNISGIPNLVSDSSQPGAPYNLEDLTPKRMLLNHANDIASILYNQPSSFLKFFNLSKNWFLTTTYGVPGTGLFIRTLVPGQTIQEDQDVSIGSLGSPMYYPIVATFKTRVPDNFSDLMLGTANAHISWKYNGVQFFGFPMEMRQKPGLNEMQEWKVLLSPKTNLANLIDLNIDGLKYITMGPNSIYVNPLNGVQFVPEGAIISSRYHTKPRTQFWFSEQISYWLNQNNYFMPFQTTDQVQLQFQTNGLSPVVVNLYSCSNNGTPISSTNLTNISSPAIISPIQLWQGNVDLSSLTPGQYYLEVVAGSGGTAAKLISEGLDVRTDWPETVLFEYTSSKNKQGGIFVGTGWAPSLRVKGFYDNRMKPKYAGAFYKDQPQNISILNAIHYATDELWIVGDEGVPDFVIDKVSRIMLLDGTTIDGQGYSLDEGAEWEETFITGNPKKFWKAEIRQTQNTDGIAVNASGVDTTGTLLVTLDANAFGPNANDLGTQQSDIIQIQTQ